MTSEFATDEFPVGARVVLVELTKAPQYNGKHGIIRSAVANGRQQVYVEELLKTLAIKTSNLEYEERQIDSLTVKELKTILKKKTLEENTTGMDVSDLRDLVSSHTSSPREIAELLAPTTSTPASNSTSSTASTTTDASVLQNQMDALSNMSPEQLQQQARAMRAMDPATVRRMNPQLANMTDDQIRFAISQMETMASNPTMFQAAKDQMSTMTPEQIQQQQAAVMGGLNNNTSSGAATAGQTNNMAANVQQQLNNLSPEQIKQQAQAMRTMDPDMIRRMDPQLANMTDDQIRAAADQMETMASNPAVFHSMREQVKNMSPQDLQNAMQNSSGGGGAAANTAGGGTTAVAPADMDPSKLLQSMDPKQLKEMMGIVKDNPQLLKQARAMNPAMASMSDEQLAQGLEMFSQMDDATLESTLKMVTRIQKVTQPLTSTYSRVNNWVGGHLIKIVILLVLGAIAFWVFRGATEDGLQDNMLQATTAEQVVSHEEQDEFVGTEF